MKVLVVAPEPFFSPRGTPLSVYYRILILSESGVELDLLTYGQGQNVELEGVRILRIPAFRFLGAVKVGPSWQKLLLDAFLVVRTVGLLVSRRYDALFAHEESVFFCRFLKPVFRFKLVYEMHSSLPQQLTNFRFTRSRVLIRLFEKLEETCLRTADAVITISPALADYALQRMPDPGRHCLIENSLFDDIALENDHGEPEPEGPWMQRIPPGRAVVAYAGTFEGYQGLDLLIAAHPKVLSSRPDAFLLMIGGTPRQVEETRSLAAECGVQDDCLFTGTLSRGQARRLLSAAEVVTSPRSRGMNTPLKIYELLAGGKPLVATRVEAHTQVLTSDTCFLADPDPQSLAEQIVLALSDGERRRQVVEAADRLYRRDYSRAAYVGKVNALLEALG